MLKLQNVAISSPNRLLLMNVNFCMLKGEIVQIKGVNGIGKSSLMKSIAGICLPFKGDILWQEKSIFANNKNIFLEKCFYMSDKLGLREDFSIAENLYWYANLYNKKINLNNILSKINLLEKKHLKVTNLSSGEKKKVSFIRVLLNKFRLWILDELFTSLDSKTISFFNSILLNHLKKGGMVLISSHQECDLYFDQIINLENYSVNITL